jgi:hypothetical protein
MSIIINIFSSTDFVIESGDANAEIYLEGISIFEKSRQKYCESNIP